ncbi:U6 small nuclear RNA (adenine-(43)-N(6))-methyltransferase [Impatiens glandulifera]|uniref:U6 small nuclear RNA (adenine-(43)-N(6))-methyltransferase n=1 Tax=Impatiens glandulifera TaxID=253017 RepID=UPI001FB156C9|nr:U6 small nuclear RNA (adenine-(43)-N(6))-methyltransferase [Impatiens glandulifera]
MAGKKRKRPERPTIHPRNKYSDNPPDFRQLASLYPSFEPFVFYSRDGRPRIDWTDFNATRELTRVLLLHDHALNWWIPDGQLCPTVPNRSNYIHWIEDLLSSDIIEKTHFRDNDDGLVRGFDIGTGANCIYPLLGASLLGWSFIGSDMTDVAIEWAEANVKNNPQISKLIEIRKVKLADGDDASHPQSSSLISEEGSSLGFAGESYRGPNILVGVVADDETFDFCMCNPPFFETMEESGLNPKTACGGTTEEMVCPGGEQAFIGRIIEDSVKLKQQFRWYTSMVGKKCNLKVLLAKLREIGVSVVKTTEFVQGRTSRWGLAWSFMPFARKIISSHVAEKSVLSFTLEGIQRQYGAINVLQMVESFFSSSVASCKSDLSTFTVNVTASVEQFNNLVLRNGQEMEKSDCELPTNEMSFRITVFQQNPGTLLVRGSLQHQPIPSTGGGLFSLVFLKLEEVLRRQFCKGKQQP